MGVCSQLLQLCPTLCNPMDCSPPGSSVGLSQQEYWRELPCPPPGELPDAEIELTSAVAPALAGKFFTTEPPWKPISTQCILINGSNYGGSDRKKDECKKGKVVKNLKLLTSIKLININIFIFIIKYYSYSLRDTSSDIIKKLRHNKDLILSLIN